MSTVLFLIHLPFDENSRLNKELSGKDLKQTYLDEVEEKIDEDDDEYILMKDNKNVEDAFKSEKDKKDQTDGNLDEKDQSCDIKEETASVKHESVDKKLSSDSTTELKPVVKTKSAKKLYSRFLSYDATGVAVNIFKKNKITKASWQRTENGEYWQVLFPLESKRSDEILNQLLTAGIGNNNFSSISIIPVTVNFPSMLLRGEEQDQNDSLHGDQSELRKSEMTPKREQFFQSIKSRLTVAQVIDVVRSGSQLTFDYVMLIVMASLIAAVGLVENSSVLLVASMLVSPLMGPILGGTFGIVLRYKRLWKPGILNELLGLSICLVAGFIFGIICGSGVPGWNKVTQEMASRGALRSLYVGVIVAIPSGAGVALSILGGNAGSLVGVAISASLLPPAVNAGICWAFAIINAITKAQPSNTTDVTQVKVNLEDYTPGQLGEMGAISVTLTVVKEVAPRTGTAVTKDFWKKDLKTTREYLKAHTMDSTKKMGDKILEEWGKLEIPNFTTIDTVKPEEGARIVQELKKRIKALEYEPTFNGIVRRLPGKVSGTVIKQLFDAPQGKLEPISRFQVTKAYNLGATTFHSNSRFTINTLNEDTASVSEKSKKMSTSSQPLLLSVEDTEV
ncbi:uncharacterized protein LOC130613074 isoform X2 [Hydractinia symbiolongicarpus]|uniref:uncharacterized protein LOC130613074 isoform X2 n=1 Tax=Hydractinia symbiolongicarpus TaxID=13093 RepID=UPI00254A589B|nr:uncharacterized protein LOC130613074 isoform X2 [Hydractinia symbiolongicarpus]